MFLFTQVKKMKINNQIIKDITSEPSEKSMTMKERYTNRMKLYKIKAFAGLLPFLTACVQVPETTIYDTQLPSISIDGYRYHAETFGSSDNPPVIVIHGGPGADYHYLLALKALSDEFFVLFYDQQGSGLSPRTNEVNYSMSLFVEELNKLVDVHSRGRKVRLIGHSWGAMIASAYIGEHGDKVSHAVLAEPGILNSESAKAMMEELKHHQTIWQKLRIVPLILRYPFIRSEDGHEKMDYITTKMMGAAGGPPYQCEGDKLEENLYIRAGYKVMSDTVIPLYKDPTSFKDDYTNGVKSFNGKLLLLSSSCSFIGYDFQEKYHRPKLTASTQHTMIQNTGHNMFNFKPKESLEIVRGFLRND